MMDIKDAIDDHDFTDLFLSVRESPTYWMQVALLEFKHSLGKAMEEKGGINRKKLADLVGVKPSVVSRWLSANENLTIETMCRLAFAIGSAIHIHVADRKERGRWHPEIGEAVAHEAAEERPAVAPALSAAYPRNTLWSTATSSAPRRAAPSPHVLSAGSARPLLAAEA